VKRRRFTWKAIFLFIFIAPCIYDALRAQPRVYADSAFAPSLATMKKYVIIMPDRYSPSRRYPILYLLHGWGGACQDWTAKTDIKKHVDDVPIITVMPDAENSWYVDSYSDSTARFESYLMNDLPKTVQEKYSVDTTKQAIAGLSMGGYGALALGLRHPKKFKFIGSLSGLITVPRDIDARTDLPAMKTLLLSLEKAFGDTDNSFRAEHDPFVIYKNTPSPSLPYIYLVVGVRDGYPASIPRHHEFSDLLRAYGAEYEYHEPPGEHNWQFWDKEIQGVLKRMRRVMRF